MLIDCRVAGVTVSAMTLEVIPLWVAEMFVEPRPWPVARPLPETVAAAVLEEFQVAELVRFWVLPSLKVPVAVNCSVLPLAIEVLGAVMLIDCRVAGVTVSAMTLEVIPFWVAEMSVEPRPWPVARPLPEMVAAAVLEEFQVAVLLRFCVLPSLKVPVALN